MANKKISAFVSNPTRSPLDTLTGLDVSASAANQNAFWSLNTLFSVITDNTTDGAIRFGGVTAPAVSAAGQGWLYFDSGSNTLKLSQNTGAYADVRSGTVTVPQGGTGLTTLTAYALMAAGTTATGNMQQVSGLGSSGQVLTSNGAAALPTWQTTASGSGAILQSIRTIAVSGAILSTDGTVLGNCAGGVVTGTLPTAVGIAGRVLILKKTDVTVNAYNIASTGGQTFDGQASPYSLTITNETLAVQSDGANWQILWHF